MKRNVEDWLTIILSIWFIWFLASVAWVVLRAVFYG